MKKEKKNISSSGSITRAELKRLPLRLSVGSTSVFLYTSTPFHLHFGWWTASAFRMRDLWILKTHTHTKSGSSWYQHATDDICICRNSKDLYTEDICPFPHRPRRTLNRYSFKSTSPSKADLTKWDPSDNNICIQTSRLQNLNPYEHLILISPPSKTRSTWGQTTAIIVMHKQ